MLLGYFAAFKNILLSHDLFQISAEHVRHRPHKMYYCNRYGMNLER